MFFCIKRLLFFLLFIHFGVLFSVETLKEKQETTVFYIVRHGQTDWNVEERIQGHTDIPLNERGRKQAVELSDRLKAVTFHYCYSSDLQRAIQTAHILKGNHSIDLKVDQRLRERYFGSWEGRLSSELNGLLQEETAVESNASVQERIMAFLQEIAEIHPESNILITTHGGVMRNFIAIHRSLPVADVHVDNMALVQLEMSNGQMHIVHMQGIELP
jgi:broad specificity phosphatase PhoE